MTYDDFRSLLGEGFHTGFRKAAESPASSRVWNDIHDMPDGEYGQVIEFVAEPTWGYLFPPPEVRAAHEHPDEAHTRLVAELEGSQAVFQHAVTALNQTHPDGAPYRANVARVR